MTDAPAPSTKIETLAPCALIAVDVWGDLAAVAGRFGAGGLPALGRSADLPPGWRAIRVEPTVWWLAGRLESLEETLDRTTKTLAQDGAATDMSGAFARLAIRGPHWRELLMFGGVFDAEDPRFAPDGTAGTLLHHTAVRYDVVAPDRLILYVAPSYAADLLHHLRAAAQRRNEILIAS